MKGRALSFENHMNFRSTDPAMMIASAFKRSASSHSAAPAPCTSPPNAQRKWRCGELNAPKDAI
jgi:hypothetical protein